MAPPSTVADLLARCLAAQGVRRVFRSDRSEVVELPGLAMVEAPGDELAVVLADADGRLATGSPARPGVALCAGGRLRLSSQPGLAARPLVVTDPVDLPLVIGGWTVGEVLAAVELDLGGLDLAAPAPAGAEPLAVSSSTEQLVTLSASLAGFRTALLVGPGVVRHGHQQGVADAAVATGAFVVATPGALGVLPLDHPAWSGTVGLQADDAELSGLASAELVVTAGIDPAEAPELADTVQVLEVEPWHLGLMARHWPDAARTSAGSALTRRLRALVQEAGGPVAELVAAAGHTRRLLPAAGVVAADAGPAGLWLARGLVEGPAPLVVPALPTAGFATAAALVAALDDRPALAVTTEPLDPVTEALLDLAERLALPLVVEAWGRHDRDGGSPTIAERLRTVVDRGGRGSTSVPVDLTATTALVELAGAVVAWTSGADPRT